MFLLFGLLVPILGITGTIWFLIFSIIPIYLYFKIKKKQSYWQKKGVKHVKPKFLVGNMEIIRSKSFVEKSQEIYNAFPEARYHGAYEFTTPTLFIRDPDLIKQITVKDFDHFRNHREIVSADSDPLWSKNLVSSRDDRWRDLRSTLSPSFTSSKMKIMFNLMDECARQFIDYFKNQNEDLIEMEIKDSLSRFTNDVIASTAFGLKCDSLRDRENSFYMMGKDASNFGGLRMLKFFAYGFSPALSQLLRIKIIPTQIANYFSKIIEDTIKTRKEQKIIRPDMIHLLMEVQKERQDHEENTKVDEGLPSVSESETTKNRQKQEMTTDDITAQAFVFFLAGFESVAALMSFVFYELTQNQDVQDRLREEINTVDEKVTYESLLSLKYLDMVVSETLRKWPSSVVTDRQVSKDYTIEPKSSEEKPLILEKGMLCVVPIYAIHRDPKFYPDPDKFDPERFSDENKRKINPSVYLPFGAGPRNCIGSRFALLESKLIIFYVLKNFRLVPVDKTQSEIKIDKNEANIVAEGGIWLGLAKI